MAGDKRKWELGEIGPFFAARRDNTKTSCIVKERKDKKRTVLKT